MDWPKFNSKTWTILETVHRLADDTGVGRTPVAEIHLEIGGSKEVIRTILSMLKKSGLVEAPLRGIYRVTDSGQMVLNRDSRRN